MRRLISCALSATAALVERKDVIVDRLVFPVFMAWAARRTTMNMMVSLRPGMEKDRDEVIRALIDIQYDTK